MHKTQSFGLGLFSLQECYNLIVCTSASVIENLNFFLLMHFPEFKTQTLSLQASLICRDGVYLSERKAGDFFVALYALFDYYAEVYYQLQTSEVMMITSFKNTSLLEPYLAKVDLRGILDAAPYQ